MQNLGQSAKFSRVRFTSIAFVLAAVCCFVVLTASGCSGGSQAEDTSTSQSTTQSESSQSEETQSSSSENLVTGEGFTFEAPENWEWTGGNEPFGSSEWTATLTRQLQSSDLPDTKGYLIIDRRDLEKTEWVQSTRKDLLDPEKWTDEDLLEFARETASPKPSLVSTDILHMDGESAVWYVYTNQLPNIHDVFVTVACLHGDKIFYLQFTYTVSRPNDSEEVLSDPEDMISDLASVMQEVVASWKWTS